MKVRESIIPQKLSASLIVAAYPRLICPPFQCWRSAGTLRPNGKCDARRREAKPWQGRGKRARRASSACRITRPQSQAAPSFGMSACFPPVGGKRCVKNR